MSINKDPKKAPNLRFKGFTDDWEQRRLRDIANYRNGKAHEQVEDKKGLYTIINSKFISTDGKVKRRTNKQVEPMFTGELAIVLSDLPNGKALSKVFLINKNGKYTLNQRIAGITPNENINSKFLKYRMNRHKYFLKFDSGVSQTNLSKPEVENFVAFYPCFEEQDKIGNLLNNVDNIFTLHQRKLDQLNQLKEALLQQMFPGKGETVPKLRFAGFEGEWEERKLGEIASITTGKLDANAMVEGGAYDFYTSGIKKYSIDKAAFEGPAITIAGNGATVGYMHLADGKFNAYQRTYVLTKLSSDRLFTFYEISNKLPKKIQQEARTGNIPYIVMDMLTELKLSIPNSREQNHIGTFFKSLDNTITLQQRKLDQLKNMKQVLLQNMFI